MKIRKRSRYCGFTAIDVAHLSTQDHFLQYQICRSLFSIVYNVKKTSLIITIKNFIIIHCIYRITFINYYL